MKKYLSSLISHLSSRKGFTLIELLVAISIIGMLSAFLLANFVGVRQRARDGVRKSDLRQIQSALELYRSDKAEYPANSSLSTCGSALQDASNPPVVYMKKIPCDPSSKAVYTYSSDKLTYKIIACLENGKDSQIDAKPDTSPCDGKTNFAYILQNP